MATENRVLRGGQSALSDRETEEKKKQVKTAWQETFSSLTIILNQSCLYVIIS